MFSLWYRWLLVATLATILLGLELVLFSQSALFAPLNSAVEELFFGTGAVPPEVGEYQRFMHALTGSVTAAWGSLAAFVVVNAFARREPWGWYALAVSVVAWYGLEVAVSYYFLAFAQFAFASLLLAALVPPLVATWPEFAIQQRRPAGAPPVRG